MAQAYYDGGQQNFYAIILYLYDALREEWCPDGRDLLVEVRGFINTKAEN